MSTEKLKSILSSITGFCCSVILSSVIIMTWSKEKSLWSDNLDLTTESFWILENRRLKPNNPEYVLRMIFLSCHRIGHLCKLNSVSATGRGAYCNSISGEACSMPRPYSMGLGLHFFHSLRGTLRLWELSWNSDVPLKRYGFVLFDDLNTILTQSIQTKIWP